jgi:S1-C subfamily serine protease
MDPIAIRAIANILFAPGAPETFRIEELYGLAAAYEQADVDEILLAMKERSLIRASFDHTKVHPRTDGKVAAEDGSLVALVLGYEYIIAESREAVVHVIVKDQNGEHGGTGFFSADFKDCIITALHVVNGRELLRVEDHKGEVVCRAPMDLVTGPADLDIAVIRCRMPEFVTPLRVEWRPEAIDPPADVLVMGYPPIARHYPALYQARGTVNATPLDYNRRIKLALSDITKPGCSGGPVISKRGFVVGVIEQQNSFETEQQTYVFPTATPAYYVREVMPDNAFVQPRAGSR